MYALHHSHEQVSDEATVARQLVQANIAYGDSNNPGRNTLFKEKSRAQRQSLEGEDWCSVMDPPVLFS
ncbi:hypothetical protein [Marinobacter changyiensis]|uniref:hypothetical protein n=1 Tax=Marinobacter changyiensis TaxID=2604091 RepID=UPI001264A1AB|nr:hypothetical protein [Marinobacter changyiensis]